MKRILIIVLFFCIFINFTFSNGMAEGLQMLNLQAELDNELYSLDISIDFDYILNVRELPLSSSYGYHRAMQVIDHPVENKTISQYIATYDKYFIRVDSNIPQNAVDDLRVLLNIVREYKAGKINMRNNSFGSYMMTYLLVVISYYKEINGIGISETDYNN